MKSIKLKPLYLKANEILIQPPPELSKTIDYSLPANSSMTLSSIDNLPSVIRGRSLRAKYKPTQGLEEKETVENLSNFRSKLKKLSKSPLTKRVSYKRLNTLGQDSPEKPMKETPNIENLLKLISVKEKGQVKNIENEFSKYTEENKQFEENIILQRKAKESQIKNLNKKISELKSDLLLLQQDQLEIEQEYQKKMSEIALQNTEGLLSLYKINGKIKPHMEVKEEHEYLSLKKKLRVAKEEIHCRYIENIEKISEKAEVQKNNLENLQQMKLALQKEIKEYQEMLQTFYIRTLKDGMDLREDGLRWCIKAIWKTSHPVPVSAFPGYLDEESITFLLKMAQIDLELKSLNSDLQELRNKYSRNLYTSFEKTNEEFFRGVKSRLKVISQTSKVIKEKLSLKPESDDSLNEKEGVDDLIHVKEKIKSNEMLRKKMSEIEINRVVGNYSPEDESVGIIHIIKSLVGEKFRDFRKLTQRKKSTFLVKG